MLSDLKSHHLLAGSSLSHSDFVLPLIFCRVWLNKCSINLVKSINWCTFCDCFHYSMLHFNIIVLLLLYTVVVFVFRSGTVCSNISCSISYYWQKWVWIQTAVQFAQNPHHISGKCGKLQCCHRGEVLLFQRCFFNSWQFFIGLLLHIFPSINLWPNIHAQSNINHSFRPLWC